MIMLFFFIHTFYNTGSLWCRMTTPSVSDYPTLDSKNRQTKAFNSSFLCINGNPGYHTNLHTCTSGKNERSRVL